MESKFLDQDIDVVFLANKCIVIGGFVGRNYNKILMETGKFMDNIRQVQGRMVPTLNLHMYMYENISYPSYFR